MPIATIPTQGKRFPLKSLEGAFVVLRPLAHGQKLERRELSTKQSMTQQGKGRKSSTKIDIDLIQRGAFEFELQHCLVDHNLEEEVGEGDSKKVVKLDFKNDPSAIDRLDPRVGEEIETLLGKLNNFEEKELELDPKED